MELLDRARGDLYAGRLEAAESRLYELADRPDGGPAAYFHLAQVSLVRVMIFDRESDGSEFFGRSDSLRAVLKDQKASNWRSFLSGQGELLRSMAWAKDQSYVRAVMALVSAYRTLTALQEDAPGFVEPRATLGAIQTTLGTLQSRYRRFLSVFGFATDMDRGLDQLEQAARQGSYSREDALAFLALLDMYQLPSRVDAVETLERLYTVHDRSPLYALLLVNALMRDRRVDTSEVILAQTAPSLVADLEGRVRVSYLDFFVAETRFRQERWLEAATLYGAYRLAHAGPALKSVAALRQGLSLEMAGRRDAAVRVYQAALSTREMDTDEAAAREARRRIEHPMTPLERSLLQAACAFERSDHEESDRVLAALEAVWSDRKDNGGTLAEILYRRGRAMDESGQDALAWDFYTRSVAASNNPADRWAPYSMIYKARIREEAGRLEEARRWYQQVLDYRGNYDYKGENERAAKFALERLDKAITTSPSGPRPR